MSVTDDMYQEAKHNEAMTEAFRHHDVLVQNVGEKEANKFSNPFERMVNREYDRKLQYPDVQSNKKEL